ncbi:MAG: aldo/keto reductase [Acidimicrobiales bacterium]
MGTASVRTTTLPSGDPIPVLGLGTWHMAEDPQCREDELSALREGLDLGLALIDTAEMYGGGDAEELVGEAIRGRRDEVLLVSKVLPSHARRDATVRACEGSLRRLGTDRLDLYLLHWRGSTPLEETLDAFTTLIDEGKIRHWGVSNFDRADMEELVALPGGLDVATNQVLYNLSRRGVEWDLVPWSQGHRLPVMAYSPIEQGRLLGHPVLRAVAGRYDATPAQVAVAWVLRHRHVTTVPKAGTPAHVRENHAALDLELTEGDLDELDRSFPPPTGPQGLEML